MLKNIPRDGTWQERHPLWGESFLFSSNIEVSCWHERVNLNLLERHLLQTVLSFPFPALQIQLRVLLLFLGHKISAELVSLLIPDLKQLPLGCQINVLRHVPGRDNSHLQNNKWLAINEKLGIEQTRSFKIWPTPTRTIHFFFPPRCNLEFPK